ncbi:hypothetical protein [Ktedonobacter racemifer]|uniref:Uncharacterized protein n=1 Tax=Ktedonobacter racemifer DSM 44963 TaxID=485913 RepID=D6TBY3_KTERA|nr:hypothetical protein [Ktedonobacter racemifer]EFH88019.1 hypothetical protein Krac_9386 [Ktedonobacter racemifer DSM 44963]
MAFLRTLLRGFPTVQSSTTLATGDNVLELLSSQERRVLHDSAHLDTPDKSREVEPHLSLSTRCLTEDEAVAETSYAMAMA